MGCNRSAGRRIPEGRRRGALVPGDCVIHAANSLDFRVQKRLNDLAHLMDDTRVSFTAREKSADGLRISLPDCDIEIQITK
jgi:hypothetical protein